MVCLLLYLIVTILQNKKIIHTTYLNLFVVVISHVTLGIVYIDGSYLTYLLAFIPIIYCLSYLKDKEYKVYIHIAGAIVTIDFILNSFLESDINPLPFVVCNYIYSVIIALLSMDIFYHHVVVRELEVSSASNKYEEESIHDELTGLLNRRAFATRYNSFVDANTPFTIALCDIDDFKTINDTYGHLVGDTVLKGISKVFLSCVRKSDDVYRWGGEEFLLLLQTNQQNAYSVMERIRTTIEELNFGDNIKVTISIGLMEHRSDFDSISMVSATDSVLYQSKKNGKNRTTIYENRL